MYCTKLYTSTTSIGHTLPPGMVEISDHYLMLKSLLPDEVKVIIIIDDIRIESKLTTHTTLR